MFLMNIKTWFVQENEQVDIRNHVVLTQHIIHCTLLHSFSKPRKRLNIFSSSTGPDGPLSGVCIKVSTTFARIIVS